MLPFGMTNTNQDVFCNSSSLYIIIWQTFRGLTPRFILAIGISLFRFHRNKGIELLLNQLHSFILKRQVKNFDILCPNTVLGAGLNNGHRHSSKRNVRGFNVFMVIYTIYRIGYPHPIRIQSDFSVIRTPLP
jgi:hypothetical protein